MYFDRLSAMTSMPVFLQKSQGLAVQAVTPPFLPATSQVILRQIGAFWDSLDLRFVLILLGSDFGLIA
jgi:hypothetical protein